MIVPVLSATFTVHAVPTQNPMLQKPLQPGSPELEEMGNKKYHLSGQEKNGATVKNKLAATFGNRPTSTDR